MNFRQVLRDGTIATLKAAATLAGDQVAKEKAVPTGDAALPLLAVYVPLEHKTTISEGAAPLFRASLSLHVEARVAATNEATATADLDTLIDQVQIGLLCNPDFMRTRPAWPIEHVTEIAVRTEIDGSGRHFIGKGLVALTISYRDEYPPTLPDELRRIVMSMKPNAAAPAPPEPPATVMPEISLEIP